MRSATVVLLELLHSAGISSCLFEPPFEEPDRFDLGLRKLLAFTGQEAYRPVLRIVEQLEENCLYHIQDQFFSKYAVFRIPHEEKWLSICPMLIDMPSGEQILKLLDQSALPHTLYEELLLYFERLPQMKSPEVFDTVCFSVADTVFSSREHYRVRVLKNPAEMNALQGETGQGDPLAVEDLEQKMRILEKRYEMEDAFLKAAMTGDEKQTLSRYYEFVRSFTQDLVRMPDILRDRKDLGITLNSLLRKSAQEAGVHPYYIDAFSNRNVARLEHCGSLSQVHSFFRELIVGYCELIRQYGLSHYSKPVQQAILLIHSKLGEDLSLASVARQLNLNRSYLSTLFRKETGRTLSAYVLDRRIGAARHYLSTTPLSVQDIAWKVGIPDANYFTRLFKRETGYTPRDYREL